MGNEGLQPVHHMFSLLLLSSQMTPYIYSAPEWGPSHGRQSSRSFFNVSSSPGLHELLQCRCLPWGAVLQNRKLQHAFPPGSQVLSENLLQHGPFHEATGSGRSLLQHELSTESQTLLGIQLFHGDIKYWVSRNG